MPTTKITPTDWFDAGINNGYHYMIVICDNYDYSDYPVYCTTQDFGETYRLRGAAPKQRVMEVYDLRLDKDMQMNERRAFHYPPGFNHISKESK